MVITCIVKGCENKQKVYSAVMFHRIPNNHKRRKAWLAALNMDPTTTPEELMKNCRVCSEHFTKEDYTSTGLRLKDTATPTIFKSPTEQTISTPNAEDVDCFESSVYVTDGSSSESLDSVSIEQDQTLLDKHLPEETSGPTQESELSLTLLCYSESDIDQEDEFSEQTTRESQIIVCNAEEQQEILQTTVKTSSVILEDGRNLIEIKTETTEEEGDSEDDEDLDDDDDDDFVPLDVHLDDDDDDHCISSDEINDSSDEEKTHKCPYCKKTFSDALKLKSHDVDCCETSVFVSDGSSTDSLDSVTIHQDQLLMDRQLSSGPTQDSELGLTLLCYSESDSDQEDESNDKTTKETHDIVCNAKEQKEILQTTDKTSTVKLEDCTNLMEIKIETIEVEHNTDDDEDEEDKDKCYDEDDDFVPSGDNHCIPSDDINESSDEAKTHKCPYCKKTFSDALKVKSHVRSHTEEKTYQCSVCGKTFRLLRSLRAHEITHREQKPFPCSHCDKRFSTKHRVMVHERVHTGEKPYLCQDCGKSFSKSHSFRVHLRVHTGEKPYQCSQCEKSFARPEAYRLHRRAHTGVKPYQCSFCGKSFTRRDNLSTHQRIHTGEKPYKCTQCDLGFTQAVLLRLHQKKHTGGKP